MIVIKTTRIYTVEMDLKKLYFKLLLVLIPIFLYFVVFVSFDANDYAGLRSSLLNNIDDNKLISSKGDKIVNSPYSIIKYINALPKEDNYVFIFGDSKIENADSVNLKKLDGRTYVNLAFGGCRLEESITEFWYTVSKVKPQRVIFEIDYYQLNKNRQVDRFSKILDVNAVKYYTDYFNHISMLQEMLLEIRGEGRIPDKTHLAETRFDDYLSLIGPVCEKYEVDIEGLKDVIKVAEFCSKNNIEIIFFCPPIHKSVYKNILEDYGISVKMKAIKKEISKYAMLIDMQFNSELSNKDEFWIDGHHYNGQVMKQVEKNIALVDKKFAFYLGLEK